MNDTLTNERRAMCAAVPPKSAIGAVMRQMAREMRQPFSIAFQLQKGGLCESWNEASRVVLRHYPWP